MEEKLFWVGILVGIHFFLTRHFGRKGKFKSDKFTQAWHEVFAALMSFAGMLLLTVSLANRSGDAVTTGLFSMKQVCYALAAALGGWAWAHFGICKVKPGPKDGKPAAESKSVIDAPGVIKEDLEWSGTIFTAVMFASVAMYLFIQAFKIPSSSMRTILLEGDHLFVNKFIYGFRLPYSEKKVLSFGKVKRGDIAVFRFPSSDPRDMQCGGLQYGKDFIKRVIGLPGERIELKNGVIFINGKNIGKEPYARFQDPGRYPGAIGKMKPAEYQRLWETGGLANMISELVRDNFGPVTVPPGRYMVMGDNRDRSCDSRYWGPVPEHLIKGRAWFIYWPPSRVGIPL